MSEGTAAAEFAALLGELKERSGLSYGVLAKRLHMSTSTLHRYCNGDAVPTDYAPVERLARLCKASPAELVELHRRWVLADAGRVRKGSGAAASGVASAGVASGGVASGGAAASGVASRGVASGVASAGVASGEVASGGAAASEVAPAGVASGDEPSAGVASAEVPSAGVVSAEVPPAGVVSAEVAPSGEASDEVAPAGVVSAEVAPSGEAPGEGASAPGASPQGPLPAVADAQAASSGADPLTSGADGPTAGGSTGAGGSGEPRRRRPRRTLLAGVAAAVALGGVGLAVAVPSGGPDDDGRRGAAAASGRADGRTDRDAAASFSPSAGSSTAGGAKKGRDEGKKGQGTASSPPASPSADNGKGKGEGKGTGIGADRPGRDTASGAAPLTVHTQPHAWESPCSQRYLVNLPPERVGPPPPEQDAPGWVAATRAVPSGEQFLKLTVQGTGKETVVVERLTVRMAGKRAPLAWNDYAMGYPGVGCGGGVPTRFFTVALDAARPGVVPEAGHADFPFKVSESDPEVYYIRADASAYDVSWYLELTWSSGDRTGTLTVDDHGRPFRTSGNNGRPAYEFPLGGEKWVEEGTTQ
ncbi:helix-turn-helix domain-containing protein [Streptomyces sp. NPDC050674]|uniref:helix-turn-helix domain-containing protein n=1 Tax=Streptomyces sp. NPDC050674 TaxID=3157216 RepID=UPI00343DF2E3